MNSVIDAAIARSRTVITILVVTLIFGLSSYIGIPKEADPEIAIPVIFVSVPYPGISPEDSERLIVKPLETRLRTVEGVKEMRGIAAQSYGGVVLEFEASFDKDQALLDVREQVDLARAEIPAESEEPTVNEINTALQPVITVNLSGEVPERTLLRFAQQLQDAIEAHPAVLEAEIVGQREELVEIVIDPAKLAAYNVSQQELLAAVTRNNQLVAAGSLDTGQGRFSVKVPGLFETARDVLGIPVRVSGDRVVTLGDIADIRRTFWDRTSFARLNGSPGMALDVVKRVGENVIQTNEAVQQIVLRETANWPETIKVNFSGDQSAWIFGALDNLQSSVLTAIALVMIIVVAAMGLRSAALVGIAIPTSFLMAFMVLYASGFTVNMMVMFGMILAVGMLVDGAIVVVEYADRKMTEGLERKEAYALAAKRMFWPVASGTLTTLAAFFPLLFWPGVSGQFMSYLPFTLIFVLTSSLIVALIFLPVLGSIFGKAGAGDNATMKALAASESGDLKDLGGATGLYARFISQLIKRPFIVIAASAVLVTSVIFAYGTYGKGVAFFIENEPEYVFVIIQGRGNLSVEEVRDIVLAVEDEVLELEGIATAFTRTQSQRQSGSGGMQSFPVDTIGTIFIELKPFGERPSGHLILEELIERTQDISGVVVEVRELEQGPPTGKDVQIELRSSFSEDMFATAEMIRDHLSEDPELIDLEDTRPLPGIEWNLGVDREQAGRFGADVAVVGAWVQLITNGILVGTYRPNDADDEIDIRVRFPADERGIQQLDQLRVQTNSGLVPITNFVTREARPLVDQIERVDGKRVIYVKANAIPGILADTKIGEVKAWLDEQEIPNTVGYRFRGADEEQAEAAAFLGNAMLASLFLMAIILLTQFNSFYHAILILSSVILSTVGVFLGLMITGQVFSVIMTGTGVVALAGIVVNNNIVLIDTFQRLRETGMSVADAVVRTGAQRLRPVFLTTVTTVCGLLPMTIQLNVDFLNRSIDIGSSVSAWWVNLSTSVVSGLAFSTLLTLVLTPCLLILPAHISRLLSRKPKPPIAEPVEETRAAAAE